MEIKIKDENNKAEEIKVSVSKTYNENLKKDELANCNNHVGRELGEELTEEELELDLKCKAETEIDTEQKKPMEEIRELLVPIAVHEAKSAFYKLKLAKVVAVEGGKIAAKGAVVAAKGAKVAGEKIQTLAENHKSNKKKKKEKGGKNEKRKGKGN